MRTRFPCLATLLVLFAAESGAMAQTAPPAPTQLPAECMLADGADLAALRERVTRGCAAIGTAANASVAIASASDIALPEGVTLVFAPGARWVLDGNFTLTVSGYEIPLQRRQVFSGAGRIALSAGKPDQQGCVQSRVAFPEWFGARVNDSADDTDAIARALALGTRVELAAGVYDVRERLWLLGHQTLAGAGKAATTIRQAKDAALVNYPDAAHADQKQVYDDVRLQDFIVGLASDCTRIADLKIDGSQLPDDQSALSNLSQHFGGKGIFPRVAGIQISSNYRWRKGQPQVTNVRVSNVEVWRPAAICVTIQSDRAARDVVIDGLTCTARDTRSHTAGFAVEAYHPTWANAHENITLRNSTFNGGMWGFYISGVTNLTVENVSVSVGSWAFSAAYVYTSDTGFPAIVTFRNVRFSLKNASARGESVISLYGRAFRKDRQNVMPFLKQVETSLTIEDCTFEADAWDPKAPNRKLVPLILDQIGFSRPVEISRSTFRGGSYAILAGDPSTPEKFGGVAHFEDPIKGKATAIRDLTAEEIAEHRIGHSRFAISQSKFYGQAFSAIRANNASLKLLGTTFQGAGSAPASRGLPVVDLGTVSPFDDGPAPQNRIEANTWSGGNAGDFLRIPRVTLERNTQVARNRPLAKTGTAAASGGREVVVSPR